MNSVLIKVGVGIARNGQKIGRQACTMNTGYRVIKEIHYLDMIIYINQFKYQRYTRAQILSRLMVSNVQDYTYTFLCFNNVL